jgi:hypothetical protein
MPSVNVFGLGDDDDDEEIVHAPDYAAATYSPQLSYGQRDGTEFVVAGVVLLALAVLFGFVQAGFRAVITTGR